MGKRYRAAVIAALAVLCAPAPQGTATAAEQRACVTPDAVTAHLRQGSADVAISHITGLEAANLSAGISAVTGAAIPRESEYVLAHEPGSPLIYLVQFEAGCASHHGRFPDRLVQTWIAGTAA
jgi:hypothetical protein